MEPENKRKNTITSKPALPKLKELARKETTSEQPRTPKKVTTLQDILDGKVVVAPESPKPKLASEAPKELKKRVTTLQSISREDSFQTQKTQLKEMLESAQKSQSKDVVPERRLTVKPSQPETTSAETSPLQRKRSTRSRTTSISSERSVLNEANELLSRQTTNLGKEMLKRMESKRNTLVSNIPKILEPAIDKQVGVTAFINWQKLLDYYKKGLPLVRRYKVRITNQKVSAQIQKVLQLPLKDSGQMAFIMQMYKGGTDATLTAKIQKLLDPTERRTREKLNTLDQLLKYRLKAYAQFNLEQRMKLCRVMRYEKHKENTLICLEGQKAQSYYFILSGKIEIFGIKGNERNRYNVLNGGESFGRIQLINDQRMASVATLMDTEFLCVNKREFMESTQVQTQEELLEKSKTLSKLRNFHLDQEFLKKCLASVEISIYSKNDVIVTEGNHDAKIYWLLSGACTCKKNVLFVEKKNGSGDLKKYVKDMVLDENEQILKLNFDIHELEEGDHFPGISPEIAHLKLIANATSAEGENSTTRGFLGDAELESSYMEYSVVANTTTEIASLPRSDYLNFASDEMIDDTLSHNNMYRVSMDELQTRYLEELEWKKYKTGTIKRLQTKKI